jgi:hypothetical protein
MASPFRAFRKHQKALIAVAGVVLMFVFVLADPLSQYVRRGMSGGSAPGKRNPDDIVVRWKDGKLTNAEMSRLIEMRLVVHQLIREIEGQGRGIAMEKGQDPRLRVEMPWQAERPQDHVEEEIVLEQICAAAARSAGMQVSDQYLVHFLQEFGYGNVSVEDIRAKITQLQGRGRISMDAIFDTLRNEVLARNYLASYMFALDAVLPQQRWEDWLRVNDRVVVEAAAIPVESFVMDVPEPTDAELATFFDKYKNREPQPEFIGDQEFPSQWPGFMIPRKIELQYIRADYGQFLARAEKQVTDEEIQKYYDEHKDPMFIRADSGFSDTTKSESTAAPASGADKKPSGDPAGAKPADAKPAEPAPSKPSVPKNKQSMLENGPKQSVFRLTAFVEDKSGSTASKSAPTESAALTAAPEAAGPTGAIESPAATAPPKKPVEFQPLDEVRDEIRRQLAQVKVSQQMDELMNKLLGELTGVYTGYFGAVLNDEAAGKERPKPPEQLTDLSKLATEHGLDFGKVGPVSQLELRATPLGKTIPQEGQQVPLFISLFAKTAELFQPNLSFDPDYDRYLSNSYLTVKTSDTPARVPELSEVRTEVVRAWKLRKAAELALKHAEELAAKAKTSGQPLAEVLADEKNVTVTKTDPFAWLTAGSVSPDTQMLNPFRLSQPEGIVAVGPTLLRKVFTLGDGDVGAELNNDHTIAYVLRIAEHQDTPAELKQAFLAEADRWYGLPAWARDHHGRMMQDLESSLLESEDVKWERPADEPVHAAE